ncbi:hypothetical protein PYCCODRAFT_1045292 [Trametes coccinea BRFM310]|uniref:Uncharacterized protein n=1 Tax=Trametes coccinea (strain BRFM310) TaxID=1353009 RepID=A0A1Y2IDT3_TRAC3|nr:hypothetical protein PYCCODRAFT_1045292 [Trametes coccinea BRFM310]
MSERISDTGGSNGERGGGRGGDGRRWWSKRLLKKGGPDQNSFAPLEATRPPASSGAGEQAEQETVSTSLDVVVAAQDIPRTASGALHGGPVDVQGSWRSGAGTLGFLPPPPGILDQPSYATGWSQVGHARGSVGGRGRGRARAGDRGGGQVYRGPGRGGALAAQVPPHGLEERDHSYLAGPHSGRGWDNGIGRGDRGRGVRGGGRGRGRGNFFNSASLPGLSQDATSPFAPTNASPQRGLGWRGRGRGRGSSFNSPSSSGSPGDAGSPILRDAPPHLLQFDYRGRGRGGYNGLFSPERGRGPSRGFSRGWRARGGASERGRGRGIYAPDYNGGGNGGYGSQRDYHRQDRVDYCGGRPAVDDLPPPRDMMQGVLVPALQSFSPPEVAHPDEPISLVNFRCIGSYTWRDGADPTIIVPGSVRAWRDPSLPITVRSDNGIRMLNENGYRMGPASSLIPIFRAVDAFIPARHDGKLGELAGDDEWPNPAVEWPAVDIVTDRNNLRKLMRWLREYRVDPVSPPPSTSSTTATSDIGDADTANKPAGSTPATEAEWDPRKDFRIDLRLGGDKTVLMDRWAIFDRERVVPPKGGCRDNFIREAMAGPPGCNNSAGHYRIVQYEIDGLNLVVRWEVDACVGESNSAPLSASSTSDPSDPVTPPPTLASPIIPVRSPVVDIDELARWDDTTDTGGGAAWGVSEASAAVPSWDDQPAPLPQAATPTKPVPTVDIDKLALWEDDDTHANSWGVPATPVSSASPIGQLNTNTPNNGANGPVSSAWDSPAEDSTSAWVAHTTTATNTTINDDALTGWDGPASSDGAAWGVDTPVDTPVDDDEKSPVPELKVIHGGSLLPQSSVLELATRSSQYIDNIRVEDTFIQLFLTQTPTHLVAVHTRGTFDRIIRQELDSEELNAVKEDAEMRRSVCAFVALLREIQALVKEHGPTGRLSLVCQKGKLDVYSRVEKGRDVLLDSELSRFDGH